MCTKRNQLAKFKKFKNIFDNLYVVCFYNYLTKKSKSMYPLGRFHTIQMFTNQEGVACFLF